MPPSDPAQTLAPEHRHAIRLRPQHLLTLVLPTAMAGIGLWGTIPEWNLGESLGALILAMMMLLPMYIPASWATGWVGGVGTVVRGGRITADTPKIMVLYFFRAMGWWLIINLFAKAMGWRAPMEWLLYGGA